MLNREARAAIFGALIAMLTGCGNLGRRDPDGARGGDVQNGKAAIERYGCNACHTIAGVQDPSVVAAAPITGIADRAYIAGMLPTTPGNLITWIRFPRKVKPMTSMPDLGVSASDARDIAAYLYSLH